MKIIQRVEVTINLQEDQRQYFLIGHIQHHVLCVVWTTSNIQMEPFFRAGRRDNYMLIHLNGKMVQHMIIRHL